jgi:hypothetical protein
MLQRIKAVVRQLGGVGMAKNAEHATIVFWVMLYHWQFIMALKGEQSQSLARVTASRGRWNSTKGREARGFWIQVIRGAF